MTAGETEPARGAGTDTRQLGSVWALLGAVSGVVVGVLLQEPTPEAFRPALEAIELGGQLWLRTLRAIVLPLLVGSLMTVVAGTLKGDAPRGHASRTLCVFAGLLVASLMLRAFAGTVTTATFPVDAARRAELAAAMRGFEIPASSAEAGAEVPWLVRLVPANPFEAAAEGELISLLFFAVMFGLALRRVRPDHAEPVLRFFQATASASTAVVWLLMRAMPLAAFALTLRFSRQLGLQALAALAYLVGALLFWLAVMTLLLVGVAALAGRLTPLRTLRLMYPAHLVAAVTRSSLTTAPTAMIVARRMGVAQRLVAFVVPLAAATSKANQPMTMMVKLLVMAHLCNVELAFGTVVAFAAAALVFSSSTLGLPGGNGGGDIYPLYVAAGIPGEIYWMDRAVDAIPDVLKTVVNVTSFIVSALLVGRLVGSVSSADAVGAELPVTRSTSA